MKKKLAILGSTGSIGSQTLDVVRQFRDCFEIVALTAARNTQKLQEQIDEFRPRYFSCLNPDELQPQQSAWMPTHEIASHPDVDLVMHATVGVDGLTEAVAALTAGKSIALSNKEAIVMAGGQLKQLEKLHHGRIIPVDSEPSAIWQCMIGEEQRPKRYIITASGGAFRDRSPDELADVTPAEALQHPNWAMGPKITIDCATLMNKAFEVIETSWLFEAPLEDIDIVIHRQSIIHSMVEMPDGSFKAQLNLPDMRHPIQFALFYPERRPNIALQRFDPVAAGSLSFEAMNPNLYPCFDIAMESARKGGTWNAVLAGADEAAVQLFIHERIKFNQIAHELEKTLDAHTPDARAQYSTSDAVQVAEWARDVTLARHR